MRESPLLPKGVTKVSALGHFQGGDEGGVGDCRTSFT